MSAPPTDAELLERAEQASSGQPWTIERDGARVWLTLGSGIVVSLTIQAARDLGRTLLEAAGDS